MSNLIESPAWQALLGHKKEMEKLSLSGIVLGDPARRRNCELAVEGLRLNYAFNHATSKTVDLLGRLAGQQKVPEWRDRMFRGDKINNTENRPALHTALRQKTAQPVLVDGKDIVPEIRATRQRIASFVGGVREGRYKGATGKPIRHIVNIGIGGSDLGPRLAVEALASFASGPAVHFIANADAFDLTSELKKLDAEETLFIVVSKTFTTRETLLNARTAKAWVAEKLGNKEVTRHFAAVSANIGEARKFGIEQDVIFPMWDWVGGRFSLWSAAGLSIPLALGMENFEKLLDGAAAMDAHFTAAPFDRNMPMLLAMLGIWQRNFWGRQTHAVLPYSERLRDLPRYLQQLEMESNGKSVTREGKVADYVTAPAVFGGCGTVTQHGFHQMLHQGSEIIPADFIGTIHDDLGHADHHRALMSNMVAQVGALAFGQPQAATPQDVYDGGRPSNLVLLDRLDPYGLGLLFALYEHKVFAQGIVWDIDSFDQPGVELGKKMARSLETDGSPVNEKDRFLAEFFAHLTAEPEKR